MDLSVYQALFRYSPYPYLVMDTSMVIIGASGTYLRSVKRTEEDIIGRYLFEAFPPNSDDPESTNVAEVKASIGRALSKGQADTTPFLRYSVPVETSNGIVFEERYWSTVHTPVMNDSGEPILVFQNAIDVTSLYHFDKESGAPALRTKPFSYAASGDFNQAQMHEALSRILNNEREHLRSLFDQAPGFVAVLMGPQHVFELANKAYYQLVGHREIIGKPVWQALPDVVGQGFESLLDDVYRTGTPWSTQSMPLTVQQVAGGPTTQRYVDLAFQPYLNEDGNTIGIFVQGYDVTAAVEAAAAKQESDERLRDGLEAAKMVVWDWNFATGELRHSDNILDVLGVTPATMAAAEQYVHPDDRKSIRDAHVGALESGNGYAVTVRFVRPDNGRQIWLDSRGRVRHNAQGQRIGFRGITVDVTERHGAELALRQASERKDEFLAMLAHELRNPLAPISTAADMLKLVAHNDSKVTRASDVISRQVKHMTVLVDDLLDASRVTRGLVEIEKKTVNLRDVLDSAVEQSNPLIESKKHSLLIQSNAVLPSVSGDRNRLVQIVSNLLNNAAKYTEDGGKLVLSVLTEAGRVCIAVTDNGIGIDNDLLPHIFELFTQAKRTPDRSHGGLGIGLAIVKTMVTLHGGQITVTSPGLGLGSKFTVCLPILR